MTADETGDDKLLQQRVRDAILQAGGVPTVSARTGIPKKTLEKYLAKRSMASLSNAAKIAEAAGLSLTELVKQSGTATAPRGTADVAAFSVAVFLDLKAIVDRVHREEKVTLAPAILDQEAKRRFNELVSKLEDVGDIDEARALLPWLESRVRKDLRDAAASPGTGKREAS